MSNKIMKNGFHIDNSEDIKEYKDSPTTFNENLKKSVEVSLLLDFYGDMLTEKQKETTHLYYNEDLSLSEISALYGLTRAGVRDRIVKSEAILRNLEDKLGLAARFTEMRETIKFIILRLEKEQNNTGVKLSDVIESARGLLR